MTAPLLQVDDLTVRFKTEDGEVTAVNGVSFALERGQTLGIVGESGSGKSQSMLALMGLLAPNGRAAGRAAFNGQDLLTLPTAALNRIRGDRMAMIFQDPMTSLNPYLTVERQMTEVLELHQGLSRAAARTRAIAALEAVRIPDAARRVRQYPHEFSGGMRQRIMIAMALMCEPDVLIADEPTTALDVTVQAQILELLLQLQRERNMALMLITHDLAVVAQTAHRVIVMYAGQVVETGTVPEIFNTPRHPYTQALLAALPEHNVGKTRLQTIPGVVPGAYDRPSGCLLSPRCMYATEHCRAVRPALDGAHGMQSRCHYPLDAQGRPTNNWEQVKEKVVA
jgi:oligopeptide/dipeptide ABC transporter ATP-binding protein